MPPRRIPSLDGLRAISITLVIIAHLIGGHGAPWLAPLDRFNPGQLGVRVFFVISGFLITGLLLKELERSGTISLADFYRRRTLRIFPAYYAFLASMGLLGVIGALRVPDGALLQAASYTADYAMLVWPRGYLPHPLGHTWSLSVEEQFYLVWPALLLLVGAARGRRIVAGTVVLSPLVLVAAAKTYALREGIGVTFETNAYAIATGCWLALAWRRFDDSMVLRALLKTAWLPLAAIPFLVAPTVVRVLPDGLHAFLFGDLAQAIGIGSLVAWCVRNPESRFGQLLNSAPFVYVGALSYSLYLWQQPFLLGPGVGRLFPLNLAAAVSCALASYYLVERPILRWRDRQRNATIAVGVGA